MLAGRPWCVDRPVPPAHSCRGDSICKHVLPHEWGWPANASPLWQDDDGGAILTTPDYPKYLRFLQSSDDAFLTPGSVSGVCEYVGCTMETEDGNGFTPGVIAPPLYPLVLPTVTQALP